VRLTEPLLRNASVVERILGEGYKLDHTPLGGNAVDGWPVVGGPEGRRFRVSQLPPARFCQAGLSELVQRVIDQTAGKPPRLSRLLPVAALWSDAGGDLVAEPAPGDAVALSGCLARSGGLEVREVLWVARELDAALAEAAKAGLEVWGVGPRALVVRGQRPDRPLGESGAGERLCVRVHPTLAAMVGPARFSADGFVPGRASVSADDPGAFLAAVRRLPVRGVTAPAQAALDRFFAEEAGRAPGPASAAAFRAGFLQRFEAFLGEPAARPAAVPVVTAAPAAEKKRAKAGRAGPLAGRSPHGAPSPSADTTGAADSNAAVAPGTDATSAPGGGPGGDPADFGTSDFAELLDPCEADLPPPGLAEVLFLGADDPEEDWNPIARSVAGSRRPDAAGDIGAYGGDESGGWGGPFVAFLLATAATAATLAYFFGWWPFAF
jgi:hypothetical protein